MGNSTNVPDKETKRENHIAASTCDCIISQDAETCKILNTARSYLGTPYLFQSRSPFAFDCVGFVAIVLRESIGYVADYPLTYCDDNDYHINEYIAESGLFYECFEIQPGCIVTFQLGTGLVFHIGIVLEDHTMIHCTDHNQLGVTICGSREWQSVWLPKISKIWQLKKKKEKKNKIFTAAPYGPLNQTVHSPLDNLPFPHQFQQLNLGCPSRMS